MSTIEDRLRDAFRADAETVPPHVVRPFEAPTAWQPPRQRERRVIFPLAAAASVTLIVAGAVVAPSLLPLSAGSPAVGAGLAAGFPDGQIPATARPPYLVAVVPHGNVLDTRLEVISTRTGRVTSSFSPALPGTYFTAVTAANGQFFAEATSTRKCETWFDSFTINQAGHPTELVSSFSSPAPGRPTEGLGTSAGSMAVTPDGKVLAYSLRNCKGSDGVVGVFRLASDRATLWPYIVPAEPTSLSLSADGSVLGMVSAPSKPLHGTATGGDYSAWTLKTRSSAGPLGSRYHHVVKPETGADSEVLSPTGTLVFVSTLRYAKDDPFMRMRINAYSTATGKLVHVVHEFPDDGFVDIPNLSLDPSGRYLLVSGWGDPLHQGRLHQADGIDLATGRYFKVPGSAADRAISAAW